MTLKKTITKIAAGALAATTLFSLAACGQEEPIPGDDDTAATVITVATEYEENVTDDKRHEILPGDPEYVETIVTEPQAELPDELRPYDQRSYYHNHGHFSSTYLHTTYGEFETAGYVAGQDATTSTAYAGQELPENFVICDAYFDEDGKFYVDDFSDYVELPEDLIGDIVCAYYSGFSREIVTYSLDTDGTVYLNVFEPNGERSSSYGYNDVVFVTYGEDDVRVDKFKSVCFERKAFGNMSNLYYIFEADEGLFYGSINSSFRNEMFATYAGINEEDVFAPSYNIVCSPLYTKPGDVDSLYYFYFGDEDVKMAMPEGYTINDIKDIFFFDEAIVVFNDNSVYCGEVTEWRTTLEIHEELTDHMQNGDVLYMYADTYGVKADMINGCTYKVKPFGGSSW